MLITFGEKKKQPNEPPEPNLAVLLFGPAGESRSASTGSHSLIACNQAPFPFLCTEHDAFFFFCRRRNRYFVVPCFACRFQKRALGTVFQTGAEKTFASCRTNPSAFGISPERNTVARVSAPLIDIVKVLVGRRENRGGRRRLQEAGNSFPVHVVVVVVVFGVHLLVGASHGGSLLVPP